MFTHLKSMIDTIYGRKRGNVSCIEESEVSPVSAIRSEPSFSIKFYEMLKSMGLENVKINLTHSGIFGSTCMYVEEDSDYRIEITVNVPNFSQERHYIGTLAHELWHVHTGLLLIEKVGLDEFVKLQQNRDLSRSLAYKTLSEYLSWYKALVEYDDIQCNIMISHILLDYKKRKVSSIELCDTIAAQCAWIDSKREDGYFNVMDGLTDEEVEITANIMDVITHNAQKWPLGLNEFEKVGADLLKIILGYESIK